ncbi:hypothetical protein ACQJBY_054930 [Aegilops geniculata]
MLTARTTISHCCLLNFVPPPPTVFPPPPCKTTTARPTTSSHGRSLAPPPSVVPLRVALAACPCAPPPPPAPARCRRVPLRTAPSHLMHLFLQSPSIESARRFLSAYEYCSPPLLTSYSSQ